jgi:DNA-binding MarR family transcriptional regulator
MALKDRADSAGEKPERRARPLADIERLLPLYHIGGLPYFGYRMVLAARMFDRRIVQILKQHGGLTLPQWRVLSQLGLISTATVRSLADGAAVDRAEVSRVLSELGDRGLVERRDNSIDLRSPIFSLTSAGRKVFETARKPISSFITHLVDGVPAEDLEAADRVLWAVTRGSARSVPDAS